MQEKNIKVCNISLPDKIKAIRQVGSVFVGDFQFSYELEGLEQLKSGVYFLQLKSTDGRLNSTQKVVKQ